MLASWRHAAIWYCDLQARDGQPACRVRPWYPRQTTPSVADALAALRRELRGQRITAGSPDRKLPAGIIKPLPDTLAEAA
jgi:hypothetical protein